MSAQHTPMAQVAESFTFLLRKQSDGSRWPVGTKLYAATPLIDAAPDLLALAYEMEAFSEAAMKDAIDAGDAMDVETWRERRAHCLAAIAKATGSAS